ncbi:hypothetical protein GPK34_00475 [Secundilactobacillus kimchicus]|uniref:hypothetical protein n=1 Tax=Secundilactobacillus kimchicus TaxID=528209 RepID=UPI001C02F7BF|nr:hypothetical protein [Secundilactobacillus kimchicus]MBT9670512.1 hypothetical protein [Secundilactobacillus kimchicus]
MKKILGIVSVVVLGLALAGCTSDEGKKADHQPKEAKQTQITTNTRMSYQKAKSSFNYVYKLSFFEGRIVTNDNSYAHYSLGIYKGSKLAIDTDPDAVEVIDTKVGTTPYVIKKKGCYYVHRAPYQQYNQPAFKGTVTGKETLK